MTYTKVLAPIAPFIAEEIYKNLTAEESVHLQTFPEGDRSLLNEELVGAMKIVRKIAEISHAKRKEAQIRLRQPLAKLTYQLNENLGKDLEQILADELNVKDIEYKKSSSKEPKIELDTKITLTLQKEGEARELIRMIQQRRKEHNLTLKDKTKIFAPFWPSDFEKQILSSTASVSISLADEFKVVKVEDDPNKN